MNISEIMISLLIFSAIAGGMATFFVGTANTYSVPIGDMGTFNETFNQYSVVDAQLKAMQTAISNVNWWNPLTWGNVIILPVEFLALTVCIPGIFQSTLTSMVSASLIIPKWTVWLIESIVLCMLIFGVLRLLTGSGES
jgi:hypothetical protein